MPGSTRSETSGSHNPTGVQGPHTQRPRTRKELGWLSLGALGVVYGDIGTSPLYAMKECFSPASHHHANAADPTEVFGVLSLMVWSLLLVVVVKYLAFVLRADNKGEGGTLALAALVDQKLAPPAPGKARKLAIPILLALFGTGLLYGEGLITPAISVISAVEGLRDQSPSLSKFVVPITVIILFGLFWVQRYGTGRIGVVFGWVMLVWFVSLGVMGIVAIAGNPTILQAASPHHAFIYITTHGLDGFLLLGSVVLAVTGAEALYADMGHFGKTPIRIAWTTIVFPGLLLNYFGQGAFILEIGKNITKATNPFYALAGPMLIPMIVLATMAAIIASQALISGAFSLTNQAVQLGYFPRITVIHTSSKHEGQIYIPEINWMLMIGSVSLVFAFGSSTKLAAAYGIAVTGLFLITGYLIFRVARRNWGWSLGKALLLYIPFVVIDLAFFSSNVIKIAAGGWFPLVVAALVFGVMTTWWRGRYELSKMMELGTIPDELFLADIAETQLPRVPGTAVFMSSGSDGIPNVMLHHVKHNKVLHKQVVLLSVMTENVPFTVGPSALAVRELGQGFYRVLARVGFMQQPNVPRILHRCEKYGLSTVVSDTTFYLGRQSLLTTGKSKLARWRKQLFSFLAHNSRSPTSFFNLPPNRVVELGLQIEL
ncbi:MAG: potassium transporter Kup [Deltaproteobacteria bacterium]|nr:potassium transporter Kup [Deltaproteobacteria bacterium]MDQ3298396.1 potassium transporter Kup [Myxococcota bacterium]